MSETAKLRKRILTENLLTKPNDTRLMAAYTRIRTSVRNGLAVVSIERASAGSFFTILLKRRLSLLQKKNHNRRTFRKNIS
jgi:ribosomal protein RSM22 (predicted rRNA methylase)